MKKLLVPSKFFEELGFTYIGPIDGHDIEKLEVILARARSINGPVLLHVCTTKGKGYYQAERFPEKYHGIAPFFVENGARRSIPGITYPEAFGHALVQQGIADNRLTAITAAMAEGTGLHVFAARFPDRFFDVGIAEAHAVTLAAGMAAGGLKPVVAVYSTFLQRAYDQVLHDVCLQNLPVVIIVTHAGLVGEDGPTHQGIYDLSYLRHIPNLTVMAPCNLCEMKMMLAFALEMNRPVVVRMPKGVPGLVEYSPPQIEYGKWVQIEEGDQLAIIALGRMVENAVCAAGVLKKEGLTAAVYSARFAQPVDTDTLEMITQRFKYVFTIEENSCEGGFGEGVLLEYTKLKPRNGCRIRVIGIDRVMIAQGTVCQQMECAGLDVEGILKTIRDSLAEDDHA